jgi:hypothetical protein
MSSRENYTVKLAKLRDLIAAAQDELERTDSAPVPLEVALARADAMIENLRASYSLPPVGTFTETTYRPPTLIHPQTFDLGQAITAFIAWLSPDELRKKLHAEIRSHYEDCPAAINDAARLARKDKLRKDLFQHEIDEEKLIMAAAADGLQFDRRSNVNPAALIAA